MKICIPTDGNDLSADVEQRFGRCPRFLIVDSETMEHHLVDNPGITMGGGAGVSAAQVAVDEGVEAVIAGEVGPRAYEVLETAHIKVYARVTGSIRDAIDLVRSDMAKNVDGPTGPSRHGG